MAVRVRLAVGLFLTGCAILAAGCSPGKGSVSGRVTLNGAAVTDGVISFHSEVGQREVFNAPIKDGSYTIDGIPAGKATVTVGNLGPGPSPAPAAAPEKASVPKGDAGATATRKTSAGKGVPARYGSPQSSGLSLTVQPGSQTFPVELTP